MTDDLRSEVAKFAKFLATMPEKVRAEISEKNRSNEQQEHDEFKARFAKNECYICDAPIAAFDVGKPCCHWLLKSQGFGKEHFELVTKSFGQGELETYLRWVANEEAFAKNINDLADEGTGKLLELTIRYKNLQWSFSCGVNDLHGHNDASDLAKQPHYHFQMYVDGNPLIRYNDFHIGLTVADAGFLEYKLNSKGKIVQRHFAGAGMGDLFQESMLEHLVSMGRSGEGEEEYESAPIELTSFITADPGTMIKGEDVMRAIESAKAEGVTITSKLRELKNTSTKTLISPGPGVVYQAPRKGRGRQRNKLLRDQDRAWREFKKREE